MQICVKLLSNISVIQVAFFRGLISFAFCLGYFYFYKINPFRKVYSLLFFRGLFGSIALLTFFFSIKTLPLGVAVTLQYLSPIFTVILAVYFVNERSNLLRFFCLIFAFCGVFILKDFSTEKILSLGLLSALVSAFFAALAYNIIRKIGPKENPLVIMFFLPLILLPLSIIPTVIYWQTPNLTESGLLILVGIFTHFGQLFMTKAYQIAKAADIVAINYLGSVYALFVGYIFFNESVSFTSLLGVIIILVSAYSATKFSEKPKMLSNQPNAQ